MYIDDTIAAISTPPGIGGIGIIRVSGVESATIVDKIFVSIKDKKLAEVKSHTIHYGHIVKINTKQYVDEVLVSVMRKPNTFTREDIVEINCHGGIVSTRNVLEQVLNAGARLADEGEFTKRAFLNGRIDLVQAEAIIDIINSKTNVGLESAINQLEGTLSSKIFKIRSELLSLAAHLQAAVDFPEEDIEELSESNLILSLKSALEKVQYLLETADMGKIIREGLSTAIIGKPNVGKSSLLNALVRENRAIVTEIPGTTRDIIEEYVNIKGVPLKIVDTAGIRETDDIIERMGVERSKEFIDKADLIMLILDGSELLTDNDKKIIELVVNKNVIVLVNKMDLESNIEHDYIKKVFTNNHIINISIKTGSGLENLENIIKEMFFTGEISFNSDVLITNMRHKESLIKANDNIKESIQAIEAGIPIDMVSIDINNAVENLGEIIGLTVSEEIIHQIFREFCLGK